VKNFTTALLNLISENEKLFRADLFLVQCSNGTNLAITSGQADIKTGVITGPAAAASNLTFSASKYGNWARDTITTTLACESNSCTVTVAANDAILFPGTTVPLVTAIRLGLFQSALISIFGAYMPTYGDTSAGLEMKFYGQMGEIQKAGRAGIEFKVNDLVYLLNIQMPRNLIQSSCRHTLYDQNCTAVRASFATSTTISSVDPTGLLLNLSSTLNSSYFGSSSPPGGHYRQGTVLFTSGQNNGISRVISQANSTTQVQLTIPFPFPIASGDAVSIAPGCDKTQDTCANIFFKWPLFYGGANFVPAPETVL
jgi:uncharacterized phage protein (TIGR02218 family)